MSKNSLTTAFVLILAVLFFSACDEIIPKFSDTPKITFDKVRIGQEATRRDTLYISIKFQDGDGDIGREANTDTSWNYRIIPYKKFRGEFIPVVFEDAESERIWTQGTIIPVLKPDGRKGPIEGTMTQIILGTTQVEEFPLLPEDSMKFLFNDIVKFKIQIKDQAGHLSNEVESDEVQILKPR
ncbi:hypothetical protein QNI16_04115 [Cytophagaceae bacterium YF14B1]|uniref:Uncharacterized protein n=1 Tax=Xanthocytophaga flava TaxID=3048013 RepID=A0AAE3U5L6_9BACT|nr:hypothetical protein [Xanthocytophaga flavus]MDJ1479657.1 hypothetical protein [Xanthocytophaga flavus]